MFVREASGFGACERPGQTSAKSATCGSAQVRATIAGPAVSACRKNDREGPYAPRASNACRLPEPRDAALAAAQYWRFRDAPPRPEPPRAWTSADESLSPRERARGRANSLVHVRALAQNALHVRFSRAATDRWLAFVRLSAKAAPRVLGSRASTHNGVRHLIAADADCEGLDERLHGDIFAPVDEQVRRLQAHRQVWMGERRESVPHCRRPGRFLTGMKLRLTVRVDGHDAPKCGLFSRSRPGCLRSTS